MTTRTTRDLKARMQAATIRKQWRALHETTPAEYVVQLASRHLDRLPKDASPEVRAAAWENLAIDPAELVDQLSTDLGLDRA